jgi:probable DNA repair protein
MPLPPDIAAAIEAGDTVITSSARAARYLRRLHGEAQRNLGRQAWKSADILDWESWLNRMWQARLRSGEERRLLLTSLQEQQVWVRVIRPSIENKRLISVLSVSELAQDAYERLCNYGALDGLRGEKSASVDMESFRDWAQLFQELCSREGWLSHSRLALVLREVVLAGPMAQPERILLVGFDRITPAQQNLLDALRQRGREVEVAGDIDTANDAANDTANDAAKTQPSLLVVAPDRREEITTCALWVRSQLTAHAAQVGARRIAVVVPSVSRIRPELERIFRAVLAPGTVAIASAESPLTFEFSLGYPLAHVPMARAALLLLRWLRQPQLQDKVRWLVLSGFLCVDADELMAVAHFDARLRQQPVRQPELNLETFVKLLGEGWREATPLRGLRGRLQDAQRKISSTSARTFTGWTETVEKLLQAMHWPGAHPLESDDFQVQARWSQLLDTVSALGFDGRTVKYGAFLDVLEQQANLTIFSPESRDAPVQILGPLEAAGLSFDALWFLCAEEASWPAVARPHPFLSRRLQRKHEMPHGSSDIDWKLARQVTARLEKSAAQCVFSYAAQNLEGPCRPSTLVSAGKKIVTAKELRNSIDAEQGFGTEHEAPLTLAEPEPATVVPWPADMVAGGSGVLQNQAACPFRAFASKRLGAREMEVADWGLDSSERGSALHQALDLIWNELKTLDRLLEARRQGALAAIIEKHLDEALRRYRDDGPGRNWSEAYLDAEKERMLSLVDEWLTYEQKRSDFTVEAREEKRTILVGELQLNVRVDRIDAIEGGRVIIDYKTGSADIDSWEGSRPEQPQLPLYAGFGQVEGLTGVLFAQVRTNDTKFLGRVENSKAVIANDKGLAKTPYSAETLAGWQEVLRALGQQFLRGDAQVDPKQYPETCKYCGLHGLCRIAESNRTQASDDSEDNGGETA